LVVAQSECVRVARSFALVCLKRDVGDNGERNTKQINVVGLLEIQRSQKRLRIPYFFI